MAGLCLAAVCLLCEHLSHVASQQQVDFLHEAYQLPAGDSRAVLCRGDIALPLTDDHKAAREDETVRTLQTFRCCCGN